MKRRTAIRWMVVLAAVVLLAVLSLSHSVSLGGKFRQAEYQLVFVDQEGRPIEGIELRVEDEAGNGFHHYPVSDFLPNRVPTSDADGVLTFRHVEYSSPYEYHIRRGYLLGLVEVERGRRPVFVCRFLHRGREVSRCRFNELDQLVFERRHELPRVTRLWNWGQDVPFPSEDQKVAYEWLERKRAEFDRQNNGNWKKWSMEQRAAWQAAADAYEKFRSVKVRSVKGWDEPEAEELEFVVLRKDIVIDDFENLQNRKGNR